MTSNEQWIEGFIVRVEPCVNPPCIDKMPHDRIYTYLPEATYDMVEDLVARAGYGHPVTRIMDDCIFSACEHAHGASKTPIEFVKRGISRFNVALEEVRQKTWAEVLTQ